MTSYKMHLTLIFVSILGLTACGPETPKKKQDTWGFSAPEFTLPQMEGEARSRLKLNEVVQTEMPLTTEMVFPSIQEGNSTVQFEIDSTCIQGQQLTEEAFRFVAPSSMSIASIIPAKTLIHSSDEKLECSFDFVAINSHGSRHRFLLNGLKLSSPKQFGSMIVSEKLQVISPTQEAISVKVNDLDQLAIDSKLTSGTAELICHDFISRENFTSVDTINWKQLAYKQSIAILTNVLKKFRQPCRLTLKDSLGIRAEVSSMFTLHYPPPSLQVSTSTSPMVSDWKEDFLFLVNVHIKNDSPINQFFALPVAGFSAETRQVWGNHGGSEFYINSQRMHHSSPVSYRIEGAQLSFTAHGKQWFQLNSNSEVFLKVVAHNTFSGSKPQVATPIGGYFFILPQVIRLERYEITGDFEQDVLSSHYSLADEFQIFKTLDNHLSETRIFVPHTNVRRPWGEVTSQLKEKKFN